MRAGGEICAQKSVPPFGGKTAVPSSGGTSTQQHQTLQQHAAGVGSLGAHPSYSSWTTRSYRYGPRCKHLSHPPLFAEPKHRPRSCAALELHPRHIAKSWLRRCGSPAWRPGHFRGGAPSFAVEQVAKAEDTCSALQLVLQMTTALRMLVARLARHLGNLPVVLKNLSESTVSLRLP